MSTHKGRVTGWSVGEDKSSDIFTIRVEIPDGSTDTMALYDAMKGLYIGHTIDVTIGPSNGPS